MLPIGPLMIEHRLIERAIALLKIECDRMDRDRTIDIEFLDFALDFIWVYADRLHHGKEEDVLFTELDKKEMSEEHKRIMEELFEEHRQGRAALREIGDAMKRFVQGKRSELARILDQCRFLVALYPKHIEKEDKQFFLPCMQYFTAEEKDQMLARENEFDRSMIHELYKEKVVQQEKARNKAA